MGNYNLQKGSAGEAAAVDFLLQNGHQILHQNWKAAKREIDIISCHKNILHFTEVKTRFGIDYGMPEKAVTAKKLRSLQIAATAYLETNPQWKRICFNIISVEWQYGQSRIHFFNDIS